VRGSPSVAIPPYCSGQFQALILYDSLMPMENSAVLLRTISKERSWSSWTITRRCRNPTYSSGQSKTGRDPRRRHHGSDDVAIPPYSSRQLQVFLVIGFYFGRTNQSQSYCTAQGGSKVDTLKRIIRERESQSHRTAQGAQAPWLLSRPSWPHPAALLLPGASACGLSPGLGSAGPSGRVLGTLSAWRTGALLRFRALASLQSHHTAQGKFK
jgi:hypothetical protein